jgi:hypothetical protein
MLTLRRGLALGGVFAGKQILPTGSLIFSLMTAIGGHRTCSFLVFVGTVLETNDDDDNGAVIAVDVDLQL